MEMNCKIEINRRGAFSDENTGVRVTGACKFEPVYGACKFEPVNLQAA